MKKKKEPLSLAVQLLNCLPASFKDLEKPGVWKKCKAKIDKIWKLSGFYKDEMPIDKVDFAMHRYRNYIGHTK